VPPQGESVPPIPGTARFARKPGVIETDLEQELVLLDPETREMFSLNATGRVVWRALPEYPVVELATRITEVFDVSRERALEDVRRILAELREAGLIAPSSDAA
jgi:hypothetical protein